MDDARFLAWVTEGGIADQSRSEANLQLDFPKAVRRARTWPAPDDPDALARWLHAIVRAASPDGPWWVRRRYGPGWWPGESGAPPSAELERAVRAAGVTRGFAGALGFASDERGDLLAILRSYATWEWGWARICISSPTTDRASSSSATTRRSTSPARRPSAWTLSRER